MVERLIYLLYRLLQAAAFPFLLVYVLRRGLRDGRYFHRLGERFGFLPRRYHRTASGAVWLHAVSVGEALSSLGLARRLRREMPWAPLYVSCGTLAGRALAEEKFAGLAQVFHSPFDYAFAVRRVLRTLKPAVVVIVETEIWPNLFRETVRSGARLVVVNGRISDRTAARYRRLRWFFGAALGHAAAILVQSPRDAGRYLAAGAPPERVRVGGNLKYDFEPREAAPPDAVVRFLDAARPRAVWIAASTMPPAQPGDPDEDGAVIEAFLALRASHPGLLLVLTPRKPERFDEAAEKLQRAGVRFARRSRLEAGAAPEAEALLLDSMGELGSLFRFADVVFMGGSLASRGGHNILEPAFFAKPVITGPHMENFAAIAEEFGRAGALVRIGSAGELADAVSGLLASPGRREEIGRRARECAEAQRGAAERACAAIASQAALAVPRSVPYLPLLAPLCPLTWLWRAGGALRARWQLARRGALEAPVISIGGIGMGGVGKTPFAAWLAARLRERGMHPAILTRGYGRRSSRSMILAPGEAASVDGTGDEAQLFLRRACAAVGIGSDRLAVGRELARRHHPDVFILDDGFQHRRLARDLDIVLIDALDPLAGGWLPPLGRLREPLSALARAGVFVITRAAPGRRFDGLGALLRRSNPRAPIFTSRAVPGRWVEAGSGTCLPAGQPPSGRAAAFCGLANPASFWETLAALGLEPVLRREFPDHHRYSPGELADLAWKARAAGARVLLTTEKDFHNLPRTDLTLPVYWLEIDLEVDNAEELLGTIAGTNPALARLSL